MGRTILFSPVGGTDPISENNLRDGSMLHIARVYRPDEIYLYLSSEMLEKQKEDDRYRYCLKQLGKKQNRKFEIHEIERPDLKRVQDFNYFYRDFRKILNAVYMNCTEEDTILVNISSGTPAMKSGLLVMVTLGEIPCKLIQVITPKRGLNEHTHREKDIETMWDLNEDNAEDFENRCEEISCPNLSQIKSEEMIKQLVRSYDYAAALHVADTLPKDITQNYYSCLGMAHERLLFNYNTAQQLARKNKISCFSVQNSKEIKYFEYALTLLIKVKKSEYVDFVRGLTPLILELFEMILKHQCGVNIADYTWEKSQKKSDRKFTDYVRKWDRKKLAGTKIESILQNKWPEFKYQDIYSVHLIELIANLAPDQVEVVELIQNLRGVEENIRNMAAHQIMSVTDREIRQRTGFTSKQIMDMIKRAFHFTDINIRSEAWNDYDKMNKQIIGKIGIGVR